MITEPLITRDEKGGIETRSWLTYGPYTEQSEPIKAHLTVIMAEKEKSVVKHYKALLTADNRN